MDEGRIKKNQFLVEVHTLEFELSKLLAKLCIENQSNMASLVLKKVLSWEDKFTCYGDYAFYETLIGNLMVDYLILLLKEEQEVLEIETEKEGYLNRLIFLFRRNNGFRDYLRFNNLLEQETWESWGPLIVSLFVEYIEESTMKEEELENTLTEFYQELTILENSLLATVVLNDSRKILESKKETSKTKKLGSVI